MDGLQLGYYLLMGAAAAAASGPDSTAAALPFSTNLVVSIVVALHFFTSQLAAVYQMTRWAVAASRTKREEMSDLESVKDQSKAGTGRIKFPCKMLRFRVNLFCLARQLITAIKWPLRFLISCNEHEHTKTK